MLSQRLRKRALYSPHSCGSLDPVAQIQSLYIVNMLVGMTLAGCMAFLAGRRNRDLALWALAFAFTGETPRAQTEAMLGTVRQGCATMARPAAWAALRKGALATRFTWDDVVRRYVSELYSPLP